VEACINPLLVIHVTIIVVLTVQTPLVSAVGVF
jgi:hypothetical protein